MTYFHKPENSPLDNDVDSREVTKGARVCEMVSLRVKEIERLDLINKW